MSEPFRLPTKVVRFGVFEVDSRSHELRKRGRKVRLQDKPFEVLVALLERPGELVTRETLHEKLWPANTFVDFDHGLNNAVNRLREALCDCADNPSFIETVPRQGYRFIGSIRRHAHTGLGVEPALSEPSAEPAAHGNLHATVLAINVPADPAGQSVPDFSTPKRKLAILAAAGMLATIGIAWFIVGRPAENSRMDSIAVLPLTNLAPRASDDYFAEGMTEELITELAKTSSFRVISHTSVVRYKNSNRPSAVIGRELNVNALVEGTVRRSGDRVRITVQLVAISPEHHIWAGAYEGDIRDVLKLQCDVAKDIASKIQTSLDPHRTIPLRTAKRLDPEVYEDYLRGRHFLARRDSKAMSKALGYFQKALQKDPQFAQAYAGLAVAYDVLGMYELLPPEKSFSRVKDLTSKALQFDRTLSEAYTARAAAASFWEFDWPAAERDFKRAIALDPSSAFAHHWYGEHFVNIGKPARAVSELERARELDPLSLPINNTLGRVYRDAGRFDKAVEQCNRTLDLDPNFSMSHWCLGQAYLGERHYSAAILELNRANVLGTTPLLISDLGYAYAAVGKNREARALLEALRQKAETAYVSPYLIAAIHGALGEKDEAFQYLERAYHERDSHITYLALDPEMDPLRSDPRFLGLLRRLKIPE